MFRVEWLREAVGEFAELWIESDSRVRQAITEATHTLDLRVTDNAATETVDVLLAGLPKFTGGGTLGGQCQGTGRNHEHWVSISTETMRALRETTEPSSSDERGGTSIAR